MYAVARLYGVGEEVGFKARLGADIARALGVRLGDGIRVESKVGVSSARVVEVREDIKAGVVVSADVYMAVSGFRTVLVRRFGRVYEADSISLGFETARPIDAEDVVRLVNLLVAYRVPVFANFSGFLQTGSGEWVKMVVKEVSPREPAYLTKETKVFVR